MELSEEILDTNTTRGRGLSQGGIWIEVVLGAVIALVLDLERMVDWTVNSVAFGFESLGLGMVGEYALLWQTMMTDGTSEHIRGDNATEFIVGKI